MVLRYPWINDVYRQMDGRTEDKVIPMYLLKFGGEGGIKKQNNRCLVQLHAPNDTIEETLLTNFMMDR